MTPAPRAASISLHKAALRALAAVLHEELKDTGIFVGVINIKGGIGMNEMYAPEKLAKMFYQMYIDRTVAEINY